MLHLNYKISKIKAFKKELLISEKNKTKLMWMFLFVLLLNSFLVKVFKTDKWKIAFILFHIINFKWLFQILIIWN